MLRFFEVSFLQCDSFLSVSADTHKFFFLINSEAIFHQICYNDSNIGGLFGQLYRPCHTASVLWDHICDGSNDSNAVCGFGV